MQLWLPPVPPRLGVAISYRELYAEGAFAQRELVHGTTLASDASRRGFGLGIGQGPIERLDLVGALCPVAFAQAPYMVGFESPALPAEFVSFREEHDPRPWTELGWEEDEEILATSPLYSPWQLLYVPQVVRGSGTTLGLDLVEGNADEVRVRIEQLRGFFDGQRNQWAQLDVTWRDLTKLLVALQNRYWPAVTGVWTAVSDADSNWVFAGADWAKLQAQELLDRVGCSAESVLDAYYFLVETGLRLDPEDGLTMLRRARPRAFHVRWRGDVRSAQDYFDAAQVLRRFLTELNGVAPARPEQFPMDGRQRERFALYDRGPAERWKDDELKDEMIAVQLYPHGVHLVVEGASEVTVVERLVAELYPRGLEQVGFTDLGGSGAAAWVGPLAEAFGGYAARSLVVVDSEGQMARYVTTAIEEGRIAAEDVRLWSTSLEEENATLEELIELCQQLGRNPREGRDPVEFELDAQKVRDYHDQLLERLGPRQRQGLAESLITCVSRATDHRFKPDKLDLVAALAELIARDLESLGGDPEAREALFERRPIVRFVLERVLPVLDRPKPAG